ncbi:MAG: hypothetical protein H6739_20650 [Alphaproteobacteria bacterium]|nr:hypothetical protein [Alphaproteobacteria bacterium]
MWLLAPWLVGSSVAMAWEAIGPERGHVLDAAVCRDDVWVATRAGVMRADLDLTRWTRDARFPGDTRSLACAGDDLYAASPGAVVRIGDEAPLWTSTEDHAVDLAVSGGALLAAIRGPEAGLYRLTEGALQRTLAVDPWRVAVRDDAVLIGTTDAGALRSTDGGRTFTTLRAEGAVPAVTWQGDVPWLALADGRILADGQEVAAVSKGQVRALVPVEGGVLAVVAGEEGGENRLLVGNNEGFERVDRDAVDTDPGQVDYTGAWALPGGRALVGTFRRGPLLWDGGLATARAGFQATITGGVAVDDAGRMLLALMGTGLYATPDGVRWTALHGSTSAVTDSVAVVPVREGLAVLDFDGIGLWRSDGPWERRAGGGEGRERRGSHLVDLAEDAEGRWWAIDQRGGLWLREGEAWTRCATTGGLHLDGRGAGLRLFTRDGVRTPGDCVARWPSDPDAPAGLDPVGSRADGGWLATAGALYRDGARVADLPQAPVSALAAGPRAALVGLKDGRVFECAADCVALTTVSGEPAGLGWLKRDLVWVMEAAGTLWVSSGAGTPTPGSRRYEGRLRGSPMELERAPWSREGRSAVGGAGPAVAPRVVAPPPPVEAPASRPMDGWVGLAALGLAGLWAVVMLKR